MKYGPIILSLLTGVAGAYAWHIKRQDTRIEASDEARLRAIEQSWQQVKEQLAQASATEERLRQMLRECNDEAAKIRVDFGVMARRIAELEDESKQAPNHP